MDNTEIYIDGQMVDTSSDTQVTIEIKSNFFTDIESLETNRTYTIKLPKTVRNMEVLGLPDRLGIQGGSLDYRKCEIRMDGVQVVRNGRALVDMCDDGIAVTVYWGIFPQLEKLIQDDTSLRDLKIDKYMAFAKKNEPELYDTFMQRGYGYADYDELQEAEESGDWKGWSVAQYKEVQTEVKLKEGKISTGTELGKTVSAEPEARGEEDQYSYAKIAFTVGMRAQVLGIVGQGSYRAYALLDAKKTVLELADEPKAFFGGDADRDMDFRCVNAGYKYLIVEPQAAKVTGIRMRVYPVAEDCELIFGTLHPTTGIATKWSTYTVKAKTDGVIEWSFDPQDKPVNTYMYFTQSVKGVLTGYNVADGTGTYGEHGNGGWSKNVNKSLCVTVFYSTETPRQEDYSIEATPDTQWLVVNADMRFSRQDAVVKVYGKASTATYGLSKYKAIQPTVTCSWLLGQIRTKTGIDFQFPLEAQTLIGRSAIPIIDNKPDENTWSTKNTEATIASRTTLGKLSLYMSSVADWMGYENGIISVTQPVEVDVEVTAYIEISTDGWKPQLNASNRTVYIASNDYIRMTVRHQDEEAEDSVYIVGASDDAETPSTIISATDSQFYNGKYTRLVIGSGTVTLEDGDKITLELCNDEMAHKGLRMYNGKLKMKLKADDQVPFGGNFPIGQNLPDIKVIEFVKFLNLITGTFPKQSGTDGAVQMYAYDSVLGAREAAYDWSERLIAATRRNTPMEVEYGIGDWCRHNIYRWKQDEQTTGDWSVDLEMDNPTLDYERDTWELPFAASNGKRVPIRTVGTIAAYPQPDRNGDGNTYQYSACEPRFMSITTETDTEGNVRAALTFDTDLGKIFKEKYAGFVKTVKDARVIRERFNLSMVEVSAFSETRPVYLRQYGQYFLVTELRVGGDGVTEATMVQINS